MASENTLTPVMFWGSPKHLIRPPGYGDNAEEITKEVKEHLNESLDPQVVLQMHYDINPNALYG